LITDFKFIIFTILVVKCFLKVDPFGECGKRILENSVLCTICCKWVHARCTKMRKATACFTRDFVARTVKTRGKEMKEPVELECDGIETVTEFSYLGDRLNATGECKVAVTRTRIG